MDDFATVIWVVIIAGAMIFNVVSQSRKARGKGARTGRDVQRYYEYMYCS